MRHHDDDHAHDVVEDIDLTCFHDHDDDSFTVFANIDSIISLIENPMKLSSQGNEIACKHLMMYFDLCFIIIMR